MGTPNAFQESEKRNAPTHSNYEGTGESSHIFARSCSFVALPLTRQKTQRTKPVQNDHNRLSINLLKPTMAANPHPSTVLTAADLAAAAAATPTVRANNYPAPLPIPAWKRPLDCLLLLVVSPALAPLMILIALVIRVLSNGPVLFRQERIGYGGRRFQILKFRTMKVNADVKVHSSHLEQLMSSNTPMTKLDAVDPRLIPGGRWLRASGLDELPQLLNVLKGEMSLVGPRPCMEYEASQYDLAQKRRFGALPGLTGLWQVSGKNRLSFQEMIRLDVCYVEQPSLLQDLIILMKTPLAIFTQIGDTVGLCNPDSGRNESNPDLRPSPAGKPVSK